MPIFSIVRKGNHLLFNFFIFCSISFSFLTNVSGQMLPDTLHITAQEAEQLFLKNNLSILAERLNIDQADAYVLQAKAWPNPVFQLNDIQLYNTPNTDLSPGLFGTSFWKDKTFTAQIEQVIQLSDKRKKNIAYEIRNKHLAESQFTEIILALKEGFRQQVSELSYWQHLSDDLIYQFNLISGLVNAQSAMFEEGNIAQAQLFRLKALQISLQAEVNQLKSRIAEKQRALKTLLVLSPQSYLIISLNPESMNLQKIKVYSLSDLISLSLQDNTSLKSAIHENQISKALLNVEKANAVPDLNLSLGYDRNGNNQLNFLGAGFSIDLPFFNRNKGNIKAASFEVQKKELRAQELTLDVQNSVVKSYLDLRQAIELYESIDQDYVLKLDEMMKAVATNFSNRNISLLEFIDFFESFRESKEKYYEVIKDIIAAKEELNYLTASEL